MRLRQLGQGQTLLFVAPPEVDSDIAAVTNSTNSSIDGLIVAQWALEQSCLQIERNQPLWVLQGLSHFNRQTAMDAFKQRITSQSKPADSLVPAEAAKGLVEIEEHSLIDLYAPKAFRKKSGISIINANRQSGNADIRRLISTWNSIDASASQSATIHEEHEREVAHEVETEVQIQRPPQATPKEPIVDPNIVLFICSGSNANLSVFATVSMDMLKESSKPISTKGQSAHSNLHASSDFLRTIVELETGEYLRPVNWILVSTEPSATKLLLISQYEVNQLWDDIKARSSKVSLLMYEPRVTRAMASVESASHPSAQAWKGAWARLAPELLQELHLFAGQLYLNTYEDYLWLREGLGKGEKNALSVGTVKEWMSVRRKGHNYFQTHVGQIVNGRTLLEEMFE